MINSKQSTTFYIVCLILVLLSFFEMYTQDIRYVKYLILPLTLIFAISSRDVLRIRVPVYCYAFLILIFISFFYVPWLGISVLKEPILILICIVPFFYMSKIQIDVYKIFYGVLVALTLANLPRIDAAFSVGGLEDNFCFVLGFFFLHFLMKRDFKTAVIALVFIILTLKRIVLIGCLVAAIYYFIQFAFRSFVANRYFFIGFNIVGLTLSCMFVLGSFDHIVYTYFDAHPSELSSGRYDIQKLVATELFYGFKQYLYFGIGPGQSQNLSSLSFGQAVLLHNDIMKIVIEFGFLFFIVFFFILYRRLNTKQVVQTFYLNITFLTDNTLIYVGVLFFYFTFMKLYEGKS